jgi:phosphatidylethanolamine/phosphatidyl-N-methylethanolamine N-methyltransferase
MPLHSVARVEKKSLRLDDEMQFIRSWIEKPLSTGAVMPSSRVLARAMARYVDPRSQGPVIELGPGTGPVTQALVRQGVDPGRLILVEFNPDFCRLLRTRYPAATVVQGDAYRLRSLLESYVDEPAAAVVSGLPLVTKPLRTRVRLISDAMTLLATGAPFVQFTYAMLPPIPKELSGARGSFRADLDEPAARSRVGLSRPLMVWCHRPPAAAMPIPKISSRFDTHGLANHWPHLRQRATLLDVEATHFACRLSAADLRRGYRCARRTARQRAQAQANDHGASRCIHR